MMKLFLPFKWSAVLIGVLLFCAVNLQAQDEPQVENLAFKILQKQAAEYELALSELLSNNLGKYVPENRFHLSVRIYWNPHKLDMLRTNNQELQRKSTKLPGFPVFIKEEEKGLDYYLGAGSVMKLKVEVLIDESLPKRYTDFIYQMIPIHARFVPERGDVVNVTPIPFPETPEKKKTIASLDKDMPLAADDASVALMQSIDKGKKSLEAQEPVILHPVLQRYIADYEKFISEKLKALVSDYIDEKKFLLNVKFFWNADEINKLKTLITKTDVEGKVKLPGFSVYVEERDSLYEMMANSTTLLHMEVSLLLDESVSPEVEPFMKKLIPMSVKILPERGDKLTIFRGNFPKLGEELKRALTKKSDRSLQTDMEYENEITNAFYNGDYRRSLVLVDLLLAKKTDPNERLPLLEKKGSLHLLLQEKELARAAWEEAKRINPESKDTTEFLQHLD
ncbi:hypothetical protein KJ966_24005 [bacterium]|nr:hypothetical protein [bacterium]